AIIKPILANDDVAGDTWAMLNGVNACCSEIDRAVDPVVGTLIALASALRDESRPVRAEPEPDAAQAGADALPALLREIGAKTERDLEGATGDAGDARDYRGMLHMVERTLAANLDADPARRQGFLRALTDMFARLADGCGLPDDWQPLESSAAAFAAD
ncbi:MAG: hypothetical protein KGM91_08520, partial [Burkholderiales bacterium]|nr:hypothetical protein [Burkholderiales bacterium]